MAEHREKLFNLSVDLLCVASTDGHFQIVNPAFTSLLGWSEQDLLDTPFIEFVHEADRDRTAAEVSKLARGITTVRFENRYRCHDGSYRTLVWTARPNPNTGLMYASARDVTAERASQSRFRVATEASPSGMMMVDANGTILLVNTEFERLFGYSREELPGRAIEDLIPTSFRTAHEKHRNAFLEHREKRMMGEGRDLVGLHKDGSEFPVEIGLNPIELDDGPAVLCSVVDISERKAAEARLRQQASELERLNRELELLATTDALTQISNRRSFDDKLDFLIQLSVRSQRPASLLLLDIDHFKSYNDAFGHPAGDEALVKMAHLMSKSARDADVVARWGGEEFVIAMPDTDQPGAEEAARRLLRLVREQRWPHRDVTVSIGAASVSFADLRKTGDVTNLQTELLKRADQALYRSKTDGRDRVTGWSASA